MIFVKNPFILSIMKKQITQGRPDRLTLLYRCDDAFSKKIAAMFLQVYHYWQSKRNLYIVMEFVSHGELFSLWQRLPVFPEVNNFERRNSSWFVQPSSFVIHV